jgi:hypothetical protein
MMRAGRTSDRIARLGAVVDDSSWGWARPGADAFTAMQPKPITRPYPVRRSAKGTVLLKMLQTTDPKDIAFPSLADRYRRTAAQDRAGAGWTARRVPGQPAGRPPRHG